LAKCYIASVAKVKLVNNHVPGLSLAMPFVTWSLCRLSEVDGSGALSNAAVTRAARLNTVPSFGAPIIHAFGADGVDDRFPLEPILSVC